MKILDFCINEYPSLKKARDSKETKDLPLFDKVPKDYFGFYLQWCKTEIRMCGETEWKPAKFIQLRQKIYD